MSALDEFGHHEVAHTIAVFQGMWEHWINEHPAVKNNVLITAKAESVSKCLGNFYQDFNQYYDKQFPPKLNIPVEDTHVEIDFNDETGKDLYSIMKQGSINWITSFKTLEEAEHFIKTHQLKYNRKTDFSDTRYKNGE